MNEEKEEDSETMSYADESDIDEEFPEDIYLECQNFGKSKKSFLRQGAMLLWSPCESLYLREQRPALEDRKAELEKVAKVMTLQKAIKLSMKNILNIKVEVKNASAGKDVIAAKANSEDERSDDAANLIRNQSILYMEINCLFIIFL